MHKTTLNALNTLKERIECGNWSKDNFLPPERKLCEELGVGRGSLLAIFRELSSMGYIRIERGRGARVSFESKRKFHRILVIENSDFTMNQSSEHMRILDAISTTANSIGAEITLFFAPPDTSTEALIQRHARGEYQGIIIAEEFEMVDLNLLLRSGIPTVVANSESDQDMLCTKVDFREVGRLAGREFVDNGHTNIGMISGPADRFIFKEMTAGLKGALAEDDIFLNSEKVIFWEENKNMEEKIKSLLSAPECPTAFFIARDWRAAKFYEVCGKLGLKIPDDISVISYDNLSWPEADRVGLTTVCEPTSQIGGKAVMMLKDWVENGTKPSSCTVHAKLIKRSSVKTT